MHLPHFPGLLCGIIICMYMCAPVMTMKLLVKHTPEISLVPRPETGLGLGTRLVRDITKLQYLLSLLFPTLGPVPHQL